MTRATSSLPSTTQFSSTADPAPTCTPSACRDRTTAPCASIEPGPNRALPTTTADDAIALDAIMAEGYDGRSVSVAGVSAGKT